MSQLFKRVDVNVQSNLWFLRTFRNSADYELDLDAATLTSQLENARILADQIIRRPDELAIENT